MNLAGVKSIVIPEGKAVKVTADGVVLWQAVTSRLPAGYQEVEYIECSGKQYIDTKFQPNQDTRVVVDIQVTKLETSCLYGARVSTSSAIYEFFLLNTGEFRADYGTSKSNIAVADPLARYLIDKNKHENYVGDIYDTNKTGTFTTPYNLMLFAVNTKGTGSSYCSAKLWMCQIYDNGTLVRDFVPCINPAGAAGLYDLVSGEFYGNSGTGSITYG